MYSTQKHIINKLQIDVNTENPQVAFDLKDNIDGFLKHEILPYLEEYFSSVEEEIGSAIVQIPHLSLDVKTSSVLNYKELKEDVKRALVEQINKVVKKANPENEEATLITQGQSIEQGFLHFLESGNNPWWMNTGASFTLEGGIFEKLLESQSFVRQLKGKLTNRITKERCIRQLSDKQLAKGLSKIFFKVSFLNKEEVIVTFKSISSADRKKLWDVLIDHSTQHDLEGLINRLIFITTQNLPEEIKNEQRELRESEMSLVPVVLSILTNIPNIKKAKDAVHIIEQHKIFQELKKVSTDAQQKTNKQVDHVDTVDTIDNVQQVEKSAESQNALQDRKTETDQINKEQIDNTKRKKSSSKEETGNIHQTSKEDIHTIREFEDNVSKVDQTIEKTSEVHDHEGKENSAEVIKSKEETVKLHSTQKEQLEESTSDYKSEQEANTGGIQKQEKEDSPKDSSIKELTGEKITEKAISEEQSKEGKGIAKEVPKEELRSTAALKESLESLVEKQDRQLFEELQTNNQYQYSKENSGEYQINNAGLILLHAYLKDFFTYCELLDDNNQIIDKELAVHLLHYLATKQEQQYESNMLFEKVLCGIPIEEPIERNIVLSKEHKEMGEELLEAVLTNWGVLKNASPDLLRNEFLQRFGKINFKGSNPKITVERKVHDILLDKLPWNISICRLPWLNQLLFTDW